jgi:hypothetical protein
MKFNYTSSLLLLFMLLFCPATSFAINITDPMEIAIEGMICHPDLVNSALLEWKGHQMLVCTGYAIGEDLTVTGIHKNSINLYAPQRRKFYTLYPKHSFNEKSAKGSFWVEKLSTQTTLALLAQSFKTNYLLNCPYEGKLTIKKDFSTPKRLISYITKTHPEVHLTTKPGLLLMQPSKTNKRSKNPRVYGKRLLNSQHSLNQQGSIAANSRPLAQVVQNIASQSKAPIQWETPADSFISCSFKNKTWLQILESILPKNSQIHIQPNGVVIK